MKKQNRKTTVAQPDSRIFCAYAVVGRDGRVRRETIPTGGYRGTVKDHADMVRRMMADTGTVVGPVYGQRPVAENVIDILVNRMYVRAATG